ncbi:MAG: SRPBCC domain-containing protein [Bacteroides sp.]|nr:SRPBCC domain-containing protein [Bacteroides sp.]
MTTIHIQAFIHKELAQVWEAYTHPQHIIHWNFANSQWHCPQATNDLRIGGRYFTRMEAKDGSFGFDFTAIYTRLTPHSSFTYRLEDNREVNVSFAQQDSGTLVNVVFHAEEQTPLELQRTGWQAILDNFKNYVENELHTAEEA